MSPIWLFLIDAGLVMRSAREHTTEKLLRLLRLDFCVLDGTRQNGGQSAHIPRRRQGQRRLRGTRSTVVALECKLPVLLGTLKDCFCFMCLDNLNFTVVEWLTSCLGNRCKKPRNLLVLCMFDMPSISSPRVSPFASSGSATWIMAQGRTGSAVGRHLSESNWVFCDITITSQLIPSQGDERSSACSPNAEH
jgi:hypothetical protein